MEQPSQLGLKILELRKQKKMTQSALADIIGISRVAVSQFEKGTSKPSYETLLKLSSALGLDLTSLVNVWTQTTQPVADPFLTDLPPLNSAKVDEFGNKSVMVLDHDTLGDYIRRIQDRESNPDFNPEEWQAEYNFNFMTLPPSMIGWGLHIVFPIIGRTMEPRFVENDSILCMFVPPTLWHEVPDNSVCALVSLIYGLIVARITVLPGGEKIKCRFDNPRYRTIEIETSRIKQLFLFRWHLPVEIEPGNDSHLARQIHLLEQEIHELNSRHERTNYLEPPVPPTLGAGLPEGKNSNQE